MFFIDPTISALQTKTDTYANSVDPDEMAHNEPSHLDLHYLLSDFGNFDGKQCIVFRGCSPPNINIFAPLKISVNF